MCDAMVWQKGDLFLFYYERWNVCFIAHRLVPQDLTNPGEDPWEQVTAHAGISGITYQQKHVPCGQVHIPWNAQSEICNELWEHYQREMLNSPELKEQVAKQQQEQQQLQPIVLNGVIANPYMNGRKMNG